MIGHPTLVEVIGQHVGANAHRGRIMARQVQLHGTAAIGGDGYQVATGPQLDIATLIVIGAQCLVKFMKILHVH